ncbi:hypothetical protein CIG75_11610 [Tumebacillus algifaecis]|uniref:Uncharacterized protein n=1 Tax=Tumebacillus algifaecis TaxID=1214604 RepID=A0A223D1U7_9BACL|nr:hypothetical protein [Tumebacillus algifaecis]ASS75570.1 hypothetical protein CIG75_11610 [Tumebacillus algifaecis]
MATSRGFDPLSTVKEVLTLHLLRQQLEADIKLLSNIPLHLGAAYIEQLEAIHAMLLQQVGAAKRELKRHGVRVIAQEKNSMDFHITYVEKGYEVRHCFLLATLSAEGRARFLNDFWSGR